MKKLIILMGFLLLSLIAVPRVFAASTINGPDVIYKQQSSIVTISDIASVYSSYGFLLSVQQDGFTGNGATLGSYSVTLSASDGLNTVGTREITVAVVESFGTSKIRFITNSKSIYTTHDVTLSHKEIIEALASIDLIAYNKQTSSAYLVKDDYSASASTPGYYPFHFRVVDISGFDFTYQTFIYVDKNTLMTPDGEIEMDEPNQIMEFIKNNWTWGLVLLLAYWFFFKKTNQTGKVYKPY